MAECTFVPIRWIRPSCRIHRLLKVELTDLRIGGVASPRRWVWLLLDLELRYLFNLRLSVFWYRRGPLHWITANSVVQKGTSFLGGNSFSRLVVRSTSTLSPTLAHRAPLTCLFLLLLPSSVDHVFSLVGHAGWVLPPTIFLASYFFQCQIMLQFLQI